MQEKAFTLKRLRHFIYIVVLVLIDQLSKLWIRSYFLNSDGITNNSKDSITVIKNVFCITFHKNDGAVWGFLSGKENSVIYLTIFTFIILTLIILFYFRIPDIKKYSAINMIIIFIISGAIGNLIDRIKFGYVTDFLYIELINFPVFNIADCYITISSFLLIFLSIFVYKDEDFNFLQRKKKDMECSKEQDGKNDGV